MKLRLTSAAQWLAAASVGALATLVFVDPSYAQTQGTRPRTQSGPLRQAGPPTRTIPKATQFAEYEKKRLHVQVLDFSALDNAAEPMGNLRSLKRSGSALISLSPDDVTSFPDHAEPRFRLYDSFDGVSYAGVGTITKDSKGRLCFWFASPDKWNQVSNR